VRDRERSLSLGTIHQKNLRIPPRCGGFFALDAKFLARRKKRTLFSYFSNAGILKICSV
jgi:hypothetical protein